MPNYGARQKCRRRHGNGTGDGGLATVGRSVRQSGCDKEKRRATARGDDGRWEGRRAGSPPFGWNSCCCPLFRAGQAPQGTVTMASNTVSTRWNNSSSGHRAGGKCKSMSPTLTGLAHPCLQFLQLPTSQVPPSTPFWTAHRRVAKAGFRTRLHRHIATMQRLTSSRKTSSGSRGR